MDNSEERYDAASVIGEMAGLSRSQAPARAITPERLIAAFCEESATGTVADPGTSDGEGVRTSRGWCGYRGGRGESLAVGFDDGYDFLGYLSGRGWTPVPANGDWPYLVYLALCSGDAYALAEYCEADLTVWQFPDRGSFHRFYAELRDAP